AARTRACAATSSRFFGAAVVVSESISRRATSATSSIARSNASSFAFDGALNPLSLRTNCSEAARISSSVAGGSKLKSVLIFLHMARSRLPADYRQLYLQTRRGGGRAVRAGPAVAETAEPRDREGVAFPRC